MLSFPAGIDAYSYRCAIKNSSWVADPFFSLPPPPPPYFSLIHHIPSGISHGSATDSIIAPSYFDAPHSNDDSPLLDSRIRWTGAFAVCYAVHALDEGTWKWTIAATGNKVTFGQIKQNVDSDCRHCSHCLLWLLPSEFPARLHGRIVRRPPTTSDPFRSGCYGTSRSSYWAWSQRAPD